VTCCDRQYEDIAARCHLPLHAAAELRDSGFTVIPGPNLPGGVARLSEVYDQAVALADPSDVRVASSTRVIDFVSRAPEFDEVYVYEPLLAACCAIIGEPFKLSGTRMRTLEPGAPSEAIHVDVKHRSRADGWPIVGFIVMVDAFDFTNGATRFVPGSHLRAEEPSELMANATDAHESEVLACGPAGSMIIFNGSAWHGHAANLSTRRRRSLQGHFIPRGSRSSVDHSERIRPEVLDRIGGLARYILASG
jgi:ectoine hydroxylase-related dioxygenase (phytanoyl-CoA dioxygenase family)